MHLPLDGFGMKIIKWTDRIAALFIVAMALMVYLATTSTGAVPGRSAALVASHMGLTPHFYPSSPVWTAIVYLVRLLTGSSFIHALNLLSAFFAAAAVGVLYNLMREGVLIYSDELAHAESERRLAAIIAGGASALCLAFCIPFWMVANRAHPAAFDILLLLVSARLLMAYMDYGKLWLAFLFSFLYGVGVVEYATFIIFAPLFGAWLIYVMWKREVFRTSSVLTLIAGSTLGLCVYFLTAWSFFESPGYELCGYRGYFDVIWQMWRQQYFLIARSLPQQKWLIILFVTVVPWLTMFTVARRGLNDEKDWGLYILHTIMTCIVIAVVLGTSIAPFSILGEQRLLVMPYLLVAMVFGYLSAYWWLLPREWASKAETASLRLLKGSTSILLILPFLGIMIWASFQNVKVADARSTAYIGDIADAVIESLDGREWLVSDGMIDDHLLLAAKRKEVQLTLINMGAGQSSIYLDFLAQQFDEPRMQNLAKIGIPALLNAWISSDQDVSKKLAILSMPEIWTQFGFTPVPDRLVFAGVRDPNQMDVEAYAERQSVFRDAFGGTINEAGETAAKDSRWLGWARNHAGRMANNTGVLLEDLGLPEKAFEAYSAARDIDPDNVSALLNMDVLIRAGRNRDKADDVASALEELEASLKTKYSIWSLARSYGYVRQPEAFAQIGWTWAYSGRPGMAISELNRAASLLPDEEQGPIKRVMASVYMRNNQLEQSIELYRDMLERDSRNQTALMGMARASVQQGQFGEAEAFLNQAEESGVPKEHVDLQRAVVAFAKEDMVQAKEILDDLLRNNRNLLRGWVLRADIASAEQDDRELDKCLRRLAGIEGERGYYVSLLRGRQALESGDVRAAAEYYETALKQTPADEKLIETVMRLELLLGMKESVRHRAKALLQGNPDNSMALYALGSLQVADGNLELAEDSLRHSLNGVRRPVALNDLAWVLQLKGEYREALTLVEEALGKEKRNHSIWDTKGVVLLRLGRTEDAAEALGRALAIYDNDISIHLHMGEAQLALGNKAQVKEIIDKIVPFRDNLPPEYREILVKLESGI